MPTFEYELVLYASLALLFFISAINVLISIRTPARAPEPRTRNRPVMTASGGAKRRGVPQNTIKDRHPSAPPAIEPAMANSALSRTEAATALPTQQQAVASVHAEASDHVPNLTNDNLPTPHIPAQPIISDAPSAEKSTLRDQETAAPAQPPKVDPVSCLATVPSITSPESPFNIEITIDRHDHDLDIDTDEVASRHSLRRYEMLGVELPRGSRVTLDMMDPQGELIISCESQDFIWNGTKILAVFAARYNRGALRGHDYRHSMRIFANGLPLGVMTLKIKCGGTLVLSRAERVGVGENARRFRRPFICHKYSGSDLIKISFLERAFAECGVRSVLSERDFQNFEHWKEKTERVLREECDALILCWSVEAKHDYETRLEASPIWWELDCAKKLRYGDGVSPAAKPFFQIIPMQLEPLALKLPTGLDGLGKSSQGALLHLIGAELERAKQRSA